MTEPGDVHNEFPGTTHAPVVMGRDIRDTTINITPPPRSSATIALDEAADELAQALRKQWSTESERQRLWAPDTLAVRWRTIRGSPEVGPLPSDGELQEISGLYDQVPTGRLVVLGRAGSGKSALAIRFVLDRLGPADPVPGHVVPVIFSLGSWDPETPLREWLAGQLERDHPGLAADGPGNVTLAAALVDRDRILPVLDGFDEIAENLRPSALDKLSNTASSRMRLLLTSRRDQYEETGVLAAAAAVELTDLSLDDLEEYLPYTSGDAKEAEWKDVLERFRADPDGPAATALRTPLMLALARTVYSDVLDRHPGELLAARFSTAEALENHLLDNFVPTVYRDKPPAHRECVQDWLGHLARHLERLDTPDLKWWQLGSTLQRPVRMVVLGLVAGLSLGLVDVLVSWYVTGFVGPDGPVRGILIGLANGACLTLVSGPAFALVHVLLDGDAAREPSRVHMRILGTTTRSRRTYVPRLKAGLAGGFGFGFVSWLVNTLVNGLLEGLSPMAILLYTLLNGAVGGLVGGLSLGFAYAGGAGEPSDEPLRFTDAMKEFGQQLGPRLAIGFAAGFGGGFVFWFADPLVFGLLLGAPGGLTSLLTNSLRIGIEGGLGYGLVVGLVHGLAVALAQPIPVRSAVSPTDLLRTDRRAVVHLSLLSTLTFGLVGWLFYGLKDQFLNWFVVTTVGGLGIGLAYGLSLTAWGHWVTFARIWLPLTGRLPRNPGAFLKDAHRRGVLRQAGAVYQFRHARLRDRLTRQ